MASPSRLSIYFSFLFLLLVATAMVASATRYPPANPIASKESKNETLSSSSPYSFLFVKYVVTALLKFVRFNSLALYKGDRYRSLEVIFFLFYIKIV